MSSAGGYPLGAQYDPRAPWNEREPRRTDCPDCLGKGCFYYALNALDKDGEEEETQVTAAAYQCLPPTKEQALATGKRWFRGECVPCETCDGTGEIEDERDDEGPNPDDYYDEMREREYSRNE